LAWYSTDPLQRRKLFRACSDAGTGEPIHPSFQRAAEALRSAPVATIAD
jgi:prophage DNA circulation protein